MKSPPLSRRKQESSMYVAWAGAAPRLARQQQPERGPRSAGHRQDRDLPSAPEPLLVAEGPGDTHCPCASSQVPSWVAAIQPRTGPAGLSAALLQ